MTCNSGLVTALDLSKLSISGNLSTSLFNLTSLEKLNLAYNMFDGIGIPNGFQFLVNLTNLNLSNSGFVGEVPLGIGMLRKLEVLDLSSSYLGIGSLLSVTLNFEQFVMNLSNLRELYLDTVNISRNGEKWCGALSKFTPKLANLSLSTCSISGPIDPSLGKLRNLSVIRLKQNNLNCTLPEFFVNFSSLRVIDMSSCGLNGNVPKSVFLLKNLMDVDLSSNMNLSGSLPEFDGKSKLRNLVIAKTKFSGNLPESIGYLNNLTRLDFSNSEFEKNIPASVKNLGQLVYLDLSDNNLSGRLPTVLPPRLSVLNLANNRLTGSIPSYIGKHQNLVQIDMSNNSISGQVPASLFLLPSLQVLKLNLNKLSGPLQIFSNGSSQLTTIYLNDNNLKGSIPRSLFRISSLSILILGSNNFSGIVELDWLSDLKNLTSLDLSHNKISVQDGKSLTSASYPNISTLILVSCNLRKVPSFLKHQDKMNGLDLSDNKISGSIPKWIWSIGNYQLIYLNLSHNLFTSIEHPLPKFSFSNTINNLDIHSNLIEGSIPLPPSNTAILDYSNNRFSSSIPSNISLYLSFTVFFSLANNSITEGIPASICNATYLQVLDFSDNSLSGPIPTCLFQNNSSLLVLNLRNNQLGGLLSNNVSKGCSLTTIDFNGNKLEGSIPMSLLNCKELEILNLGNNQITDTFPSWIAAIKPLQVLVLRSNKLYGPVKSKTNFPSLQIIDIASNHFTGPLSLDFFNNLEAMKLSKVNFSSNEVAYLLLNPTYYQNSVTVTFKGLEMQLVRVLTIFTSLDLSNNQFEGSIPGTIGELVALDFLNFSKNTFTGYIPASIGNLKNLESLDLSRNQLSGEIPQTISKLTFLSFMNLSYNNLAGKIPYGSQLSTFSNSSYEGNNDLCGYPLMNKCGPNSDEAIIELTNEVKWEYVLIGLGFGSGLATVVGVFTAWKDGRYWYNEKVDDILQCAMFWLVLKISGYFGDRRVVDENRMDYDCKENDELSGKKFCVYCTKFELHQGKARIHHVECDCL